MTFRALTVACWILGSVACGAGPVRAQAETLAAQAQALYDREELDAAHPLYAAALAADPTNDEVRLWLAETTRRLAGWYPDEQEERLETAILLAEDVLRRSPCNAFAHTVIGHAYNPQYGAWTRASADSMWTHLRHAVACDPDEGDAWDGLVLEAFLRGEADVEAEGSRRLHAMGFFPASTTALARWVLDALPRNAVYLTYGDWDTYPALALQEVEGVRRDVAVINVSMLQRADFTRAYAAHHRLPLPDSIETFELRYDTCGSSGYGEDAVFTLADHVITFWLGEERHGRLGRPVAGAVTLPGRMLECKGPVVVNHGPYETVAEAGADYVDIPAMRAALGRLNGRAFRGGHNPRDRSPVRRSSSPEGITGVVVAAFVHYIYALCEEGRVGEAEAALGEAERFAADAAYSDPRLLDYARDLIASVGGSVRE
ncbi:MAG TPA: hypothetical protein VK610_06450 [Rhodothermales bacterium]|nr:hypothetical protein [Rhodothermales bacterium]